VLLYKCGFIMSERSSSRRRKKIGTILIHAFIGWALCAATMGIGMATMIVQNALIVRVIGAPVFFTIISRVYFKLYNFTSPLITGLVFVGFVMLVDFFEVALVIYRSLDMFTDLLGTWIPFTLIFLSTYLTGLFIEKSSRQTAIA
jgi:ABC-type polysaccharide/polyol phosphate export permease